MISMSIFSDSKIKSGFTLFGTLLVALLLMVYLMPRETKFGYEYELNRPWRYNSLIATYDFPIYKTVDEVKAESDSVLSTFQPFYVENEEMAKRQVMSFRSDFWKGSFVGVPHNFLPHLERLLMQVYQSGILPSADLSSLASQRVTGVRVLIGQEAQPRSLAELYSTRSAYEYIVMADTLHYPRELIARCNINNYLEANLTPDTAKTGAARRDLLAAVAPASGMVQSGQRIIDRGEIISPEQFKILQSYERESLRRNDPSQGVWLILSGQVLFVAITLATFIFYLKFFRRDYLHSSHSIFLFSTLITIFPLITYIMVEEKVFSVYVIPYVMVPMFVRIFMDSRTAFMAMLCTIMLSSIGMHSSLEFALVQFVSGLAAIYALKELTERSQLMRVALAVVLAGMLTMLSLDLSQGIDFAHLDLSLYISLAISGVILLFVYPLLYLIEKTFGFTSSVTLVELTNINNAILRKMSKEAQGTFVHSMQVANLAAEVANKIGAKPQLARTGALYHDIGKMENPAFFTENQSGVNPHNELDEQASARIIIGHVKKGIELAEKYNLPKVIRDFIVTHHGRSMARYFYVQKQNKLPEGEVLDEAPFTYPGPNPFTREQAILMMCDAVEATSRSLKDFSEESISELVNRIIDSQVAAGYFKECPITFRDVADAKRVLIDSLKTIYHTRISYPQLRPAAESEEENTTELEQETSLHTRLFGKRSTWSKK